MSGESFVNNLGESWKNNREDPYVIKG